MEPVGQQEIDGINRGETKADRHGNADPPLGEAKYIRNIGLIDTADIDQVIHILGTDHGEHDQDQQFKDTDDILNDSLCLAVHQIDDDVNTQMGMLAVCICAAYEYSPYEQAGNHLVVPLKRMVEEVPHKDIEVGDDNTQRKRCAGDDSVIVGNNFFLGFLYLHKQSLPSISS